MFHSKIENPLILKTVVGDKGTLFVKEKKLQKLAL